VLARCLGPRFLSATSKLYQSLRKIRGSASQ
jgi:hypothetical protein